jgi:hypothetical protein
VSAATESITTTVDRAERTSMSVISSACSPVSGCETSKSSMLTPSFAHRRIERVLRIDERCGAAGLWHFGDDLQRSSVVLPEDSGP